MNKPHAKARLLLAAAFALLAAALALYASLRRPAPTPATQCPRVEGSYLGSDRGDIPKGESVTLSYRLPWDYRGRISQIQIS